MLAVLGFTFRTSVTAAANAFRHCGDDCTVSERFSLSRDAMMSPELFGNSAQIIDARPTFTGEFEGIAAILVDGELACTGTAVSRTALLTAAHCFFDDHGAVLNVTRISITFDRNALATTRATIAPMSFCFPKAGDGSTFAYDFTTNRDDIGLLFTTQTFDSKVRPYELYAGNPTPQVLKQRATELPVVGYGISLSDGTGAGIQRTADIPIKRIESRRLNLFKNTSAICNGDSGGPALARNRKTIVAVTSTTIDCMESFSSRVDVYRSWIRARL